MQKGNVIKERQLWLATLPGWKEEGDAQRGEYKRSKLILLRRPINLTNISRIR